MGKLKSLKKFITKRFEGAFLSNVVFDASKSDFIRKVLGLFLDFFIQELCHDSIFAPFDWNLRNRKSSSNYCFKTLSAPIKPSNQETFLFRVAAVNEKT